MTRVLSGKKLGKWEVGSGVWGVGCGGKWGGGEVGKWGSGEMGKWGSGEISTKTLKP